MGQSIIQIRNPRSQIRNSLHDSFRNGHERVLEILGLAREFNDFDAFVNEALEEARPGRIVPLVLK